MKTNLFGTLLLRLLIAGTLITGVCPHAAHASTGKLPGEMRKLWNDHVALPGSLDHPEDFPPSKDVYPGEKLPSVNLVK